MKEGEVSEPIRTPQGYAFITVTGRQDPYLPKLDEVKAKVRDDVLKQKAIEAARQKAAAINAEMKSGDFDKAAKAAGLDVKTTEMIARGAPIGDAGISPALEAAAFSLPAGAVSDPVVTDNGAAIVKVLQREDVAADKLAKDKDSLRSELLNQRKQKFFGAYMTKARQRMKININRETIAQIVG
jgi:peptidyl-prolyl cis-trans isomerase D